MYNIVDYLDKMNCPDCSNNTNCLCDNDCGTYTCRRCGKEFYVIEECNAVQQNFTVTFCTGHNPNCGTEDSEDELE